MAYSKCTVEGDSAGDDNGGCAVSQTFGKALASSCAEATADAVAKIDVKRCDCDLTALAEARTWVTQYEALFAAVEQQVEAYACTDEGAAQESSVRRTCVANSVANVMAKVRCKHTAVRAAAYACTYVMQWRLSGIMPLMFK